MKRIIVLCLVLVFLVGSHCFAEGFDLESMNSSELNELSHMIDDELAANHEATSDQKSAVEEEVKDYIESYYGEDNVSWAWIDYTYSREWDFFTMETHADIKKPDGGKAQYDIYGEVIADNGTYKTVYVKVGTEVLLDERSSMISDPRVLSMLGIEMEDHASAPVESPQEEQIEPAEEIDTAPIAKKGDKNDTVKQIQEMLIRLGYLNGSADGDFGGKTETAIKSFQRDQGLPEDGIVTQETFDALNEAYASAPVPVEYPHFTAAELSTKFEDNEIAAEAELEGKEIQVTGKIEEISESIWGTPYVSLRADSYGFEIIECYFSRDQKGELAGLKTGNSVTIQGTCGTMDFTIISVDDCKLIG